MSSIRISIYLHFSVQFVKTTIDLWNKVSLILSNTIDFPIMFRNPVNIVSMASTSLFFACINTPYERSSMDIATRAGVRERDLARISFFKMYFRDLDCGDDEELRAKLGQDYDYLKLIESIFRETGLVDEELMLLNIEIVDILDNMSFIEAYRAELKVRFFEKSAQKRAYMGVHGQRFVIVRLGHFECVGRSIFFVSHARKSLLLSSHRRRSPSCTWLPRVSASM